MPRGSDTALRLTYAMRQGAPKAFRDAALSEINSALLKHAGDVKAAALYLGIGRATLNRWIDDDAYLQVALASARKRGPA